MRTKSYLTIAQVSDMFSLLCYFYLKMKRIFCNADLGLVRRSKDGRSRQKFEISTYKEKWTDNGFMYLDH